MQSVLYSNNVSPKILITCPHCYVASRYDASFIEDAIKEHKGIECVACFLSFNVIVKPTDTRNLTPRADGTTVAGSQYPKHDENDAD